MTEQIETTEHENATEAVSPVDVFVMQPDHCSSLSRCQGGVEFKQCFGCSHASYDGELYVFDKKYRFSFNSRFGPLFLRKDGEPLKNQPGDKHPVWPSWERWYERRFKAA